MPKKYFKKHFYNRDKYSVEQTYNGISSIAAGSLSDSVVVAADSTQGMRKAKHFTVSISSTATTPVLWALVYVPGGQTVGSVASSAGALYATNQFVIASGLADFSGGPLRFHSPMSRNLNSGDSIHFLMRNLGSTNIEVASLVSYAITQQKYFLPRWYYHQYMQRGARPILLGQK